jgi:hypothetical protein
LVLTGKTVIKIKNTVMRTTTLFSILFLTGVTATAQNIVITDTLLHFGVTEKGSPVGERSENQIDKKGGNIQSSDGKVELIFPEGALSKKTTVSIQPVTSFAPNSGSKAYRMEPSGIVFEQPVQIIFHYTSTDTEGSVADLMGIAMQDDKGAWTPLEKVELDTNLKTVTASIRHFSSYVNYQRSKLYPSEWRVKVNGSLRLQIKTLTPLDEVDDEVVPLNGSELDVPEVWSVNSIPHGNPSIGLISVSHNHSAIYQAPSSVPRQNPVAVSVQQVFSTKALNKRTLRLVSNITIYDEAYEVKMIAEMTGGSPQSWGGIVTHHDEGSFLVSLQKGEAELIDIRNQMEVMTSNCEKIILNPNSNTGLLHVDGARQIKITPANPPSQPYPIIEIWFIPHPIELTQFHFTCPPPPSAKKGTMGNVDASRMAMMMFSKQPAIPQYIKFVVKDEEQTILSSPPGIKELSYRVWVKKLKDGE